MLSFKVSDDAAEGTYFVSVTPKDNKNGNLCTEDGTAIAASYLPGTVEVSPKPFTPCTGDDCPGKVFTDMPEKGYWSHDAIDWAIDANVTSGTSATTFSPKESCTRAQAVTFLWNAAGRPEPESTENRFTDVKAGKYYEKAVLWAVENGITAGTSDTTFSPNESCTRAQIVTFLWRYAGSPETESDDNCFADVEASEYYAQAVLWAKEQAITAVTTETEFTPERLCTREQIVTFLWRYCVE